MACLSLRTGNTFLKGATGQDLNQERIRRRGRDDFPSAASSYRLRQRKPNPNRMQMTITNALVSSPVASAERKTAPFLGIRSSDQESKKRQPIVSAERLDEWVTQSITEIVSNIGEAPFLVRVYSEKGSPARLEREKTTEDNWPRIKTRWEQENGSDTPDGVILVKQLDDDNNNHVDVDVDVDVGGGVGGGGGGRGEGQVGGGLCSSLWGIVIQGRGLDRSACYILETTRVCSSMGFCTHFCLARAKCFGKSPDLQLRDAWLLTQ